MVRIVQALLVLSVVAAGATFASVQRTTQLGILSIGHWTLVEKDGQPMLMAPDTDAAKLEEQGVKLLRHWSVSAPTISTRDGLRLFVDDSGSVPVVRLTKEKPQSPDWTFEIVETFQPKGTKYFVERRNKTFYNGDEGIRFRARIAEGPHRGWYLAEAPLVEKENAEGNKQPDLRSLTIVRDQKSADVFTLMIAHHSGP